MQKTFLNMSAISAKMAERRAANGGSGSMIECYEDAVLGATLPPLTIADATALTLRDAIGSAVRIWSRTGLVGEIRMFGPDTELKAPVDLSARVYARHVDSSGEVQIQVSREGCGSPVAMAKLTLPIGLARTQSA
jgi:hypothetical protein